MEKSISILKERRASERRVLVTPSGVKQLTEAGFKVFVETEAGVNAGASDADYTSAGAEIVSQEAAWTKSCFVAKYKAPGEDEYKYFRPDLHLAAYFHAEGNKALSEAVRRSGMTAYSFELFRADDGIYPMPVSDNEIAGKLAIIYGAFHLQKHRGGSGTLLVACPGAPAPKVVIIGYGNVGGAAARMALSLGCEVVVFGTDPVRLRQFQGATGGQIRCLINEPAALASEVATADLVVGSILISSYDTPPMITKDITKQMKRGSVIVDVTCGYGAGYIPQAYRQTSFEDPILTVDGILYVKIDALPAAVPVTASHGASAAMTPHLISLGRDIFSGRFSSLSRSGMIIEGQAFVHPELIRTFAMPGAA